MPRSSPSDIVAEHAGRRYSAAVLRIERAGRLVEERAFGRTRNDERGLPIAVDTRFDLASLTKVVVASAALVAVADGRLALDAPLVDHIPEWRGTAHEPVTLRMLLAHTGGFRSGADYRTLFDRDVETFARTTDLVATPGERVVYSDLGFITLGTVLARVYERGLAAALAYALRAANLPSFGFVPNERERATIPATERDLWRGLVQGRVHDEKAALMNGVAGHAGLFGDARDVARVANAYRLAARGDGWLDPQLAREAVAEAAFDPVLRRGLGWALKTSDENSCGARMSRDTYGHTGFTGTVVWTDPERDLTVVLLTNAVHFGRNDLRDVRAAVCDAAVETYG